MSVERCNVVLQCVSSGVGLKGNQWVGVGAGRAWGEETTKGL